jgi:valyl-tRNA synthetase
MVKPRLYNEEDDSKASALWTLKTVLVQALKLLHPFMPFITEEIFTFVQEDEASIMISEWPTFKDSWNFELEENEIELIKQAVRGIRNVRAEMNVPPSKKAKVFVVSEKEELRQIFEKSKVFFGTLGFANEVVIQTTKEGIADDAVSTVIPDATIFMPFAELVDIEKEIERLKKEEEKLTKELDRVEKMLKNESFISKAPAQKIEEEKEKLAKYSQMMDQVKERLSQLHK